MTTPTATQHLCRECKHYRETMIFELCAHPSSYYRVAETEDFHTITHMRKNICGAGAVLFQTP